MAFIIKVWNILQGLEVILSELLCRVKLLLWLNSHCYSWVLIKKKKLLDLWNCFIKNAENYLKIFTLMETEPEGLFYCLYICLFTWFFFP